MRIQVDTGAVASTGASLESIIGELAGARQALARTQGDAGGAGVPELVDALSSFAELWSASTTAMQLGAQHLATGAVRASGAYTRTDATAMPSPGN